MDDLAPTQAPEVAMPLAEARPVKFGDVLATLIEQHGYSRNRRELASKAGVTAAALSQYIHDQAKPSFKTLIALANIFGVSLDYLVYGATQTRNIDYGPLARYVDHALAGVQARASRHSAIVAKLGGMIAAELDTVAERLISTEHSPASFLDDNELLTLETFSLATDIVSMDLQYDLIAIDDSRDAAGRFLPVVAANLSQGRPYRFILPRHPDPDRSWSPRINRFRQALADLAGGDAVRRYCLFRQCREPLINGIGIYRLNVNAIAAEQPALHIRVVDYIKPQGTLAYVISPNADHHGDIVMDAVHAERAALAYDGLWTKGDAL